LICKACESKADFAFSGTLLETHVAKYFRCGNCGFLFTEDPIWLGSADAKSVSQFDTGILQRNLLLTKIVTVLTKIFFDPKGRFLDYGGGYGVFTRLMRDNGLDFYWHDPFSVNLFARGFEYFPAGFGKFELVTAIEVFEHLPAPRDLMDFCFANSLTDSLFFTTLLYGPSPPKHDEWWYYSKETGQHISFYNERTLENLANSYHLDFYSNADFFHLMTKKKINRRLFRLIFRYVDKIYPRLKLKSKAEEDQKFLASNKEFP
jgi:hypothetical protein